MKEGLGKGGKIARRTEKTEGCRKMEGRREVGWKKVVITPALFSSEGLKA